VEEIRVSSWIELNEQLFQNAWNESIGRFRASYAFRGMPDVQFNLLTSLQTLGGNYVDHEADLLRNFRKYAHGIPAPGDSLWNWLALAKHHGLPTRLLDWSYSPLVALHFATEFIDTFDVDGVVWCVNYSRARAFLPRQLQVILEREDSSVFTAEMLSEVAPTLGEFDNLDREPFVAFFEPPSLDERIVNQYALFSLMADPTANLEDWLRAHPDLCRRIIIPADLKWEVRDKLDQANITERVLFPGLDGLCLWLKRYYSPRLR
jgi:hypothetical protein